MKYQHPHQDLQKEQILMDTTTKYPIEQLYRFKDTIRIKIIVGWQPVIGVNRYEVKYRQDSGNTKTVVVNGSDFEIPDVIIDSTNNESRFDFEVRSVKCSRGKIFNSFNNKKHKLI